LEVRCVRFRQDTPGGIFVTRALPPRPFCAAKDPHEEQVLSFEVLLPAAVILTILAGLIGRVVRPQPVPVPVTVRPTRPPDSRDRR